MQANVRAAARKNPSGAIAAGLAAALLLASSPAQAGLFDGAPLAGLTAGIRASAAWQSMRSAGCSEP